MAQDPPPLTAHPPPARPALRPGLRVVRRDDRHLQIGVDPAERLVVPDEPGVRDLLQALAEGRLPAPSSPAARRCWADLLGRGLVVDADALAAALRAAADRAAVTATFAQAGSDAPARLAARASARVALDVAEPWRQSVTLLLHRAGVPTQAEDASPQVRLVVTSGEVPRSRVDRLVRDGEPHLLVSGRSGRLTVGPFVAPGATACRRCVDAHLAERDPRRSLVIEQLGGDAPGPVPTPCDPALMSLALAWAARDLVSYLDGQRPATWSATVDVGPDLRPDRRTWSRHPHCGCSWGDLSATG